MVVYHVFMHVSIVFMQVKFIVMQKYVSMVVYQVLCLVCIINHSACMIKQSNVHNNIKHILYEFC